jgi:hypothetical protein
MGVVIETCVKYPGGRTRIRGTDVLYLYCTTRTVQYRIRYVTIRYTIIHGDYDL